MGDQYLVHDVATHTSELVAKIFRDDTIIMYHDILLSCEVLCSPILLFMHAHTVK